MISLPTTRRFAGTVYLPGPWKLHHRAAAIYDSVAETMQGGNMAQPTSLEGLRKCWQKQWRANVSWLVPAFFLATLAACEQQKTPPPPPVPEVIVATVAPQVTPLTSDIVAEIKAYREVELRPQVSGIVTKKYFQPGQRVKEGQLLFTIDTRNYDEAVTNAQANLAEAEANLARVRQDVERYKPLLPDNAIPRQTYDQTVAQERQFKAVVDARRSALASTKLQRSFADVRSPISGQIGLQQIEVGGLAAAGQTLLATVSTLDPVAAYFNIAEVDYLALVRRAGGDAESAHSKHTAEHPIQLLLADGSVYAHPGEFDFADRALNPATGTLALRAIFPNPESLLRPGMNVRVRVVYDVAEHAILVPQRSVTELLGKYFVTVVDAEDKVEQVAVTPGPRVGDLWVIQSGLKGGERVVTDGLQAVKPGMVVKPVAAPQSGNAVAPDPQP